MPIDPFLTEASWKSAGLSKRTTGEKLKFKKTMVSEALRAYAAVANLGADHAPEKQAKLKAAKIVLAKCKADHTANKPFVAYIENVDKGLVREANRLNKETDALTLDAILNNAALYQAFHTYCTGVEHNPEPLEFLHAVKGNVASPTLIATYIRAGSPKEVNIDHGMRDAFVNAPTNAAAKQAIATEVATLIRSNELPRFKVKNKITV